MRSRCTLDFSSWYSLKLRPVRFASPPAAAFEVPSVAVIGLESPIHPPYFLPRSPRKPELSFFFSSFFSPVSFAPRLNAKSFRLLATRSEEHTSELQSQSNLVCRLLLE